MILSASRRTDLPSLYGPWLLGRLEAGEVLIPQPYRARHATRLLFSPETVDAIVFWTKNPIPFLPLLGEVEALGYRDFLFQYTITALDTHWEPGLPPLQERLAAFEQLAQRWGPARVDWRFDPILLDSQRTPAWYARRFEALWPPAGPLQPPGAVLTCGPLRPTTAAVPSAAPAQLEEAAARLGEVAAKYSLPLYTCAEAGDYTANGIRHGACIDGPAVGPAGGLPPPDKKGQRPAPCLRLRGKRGHRRLQHLCQRVPATATPPAAPPPPPDSTPPTIPSRPCSPAGRRRAGCSPRSARPP